MRKQQDVHDLAALSRILAFAVLEALLVLLGTHDGLGDGYCTDLSTSASSSAIGFGLGVIDCRTCTTLSLGMFDGYANTRGVDRQSTLA